ncbi:hypothetical protein D1816_21170 [Aquimarina sp. AD10]|uniref:GyrI-like domain-containing protein n=1 Tax=Aquimarina sp. AD10 TaxID=1714849 RepID=UPI000E4CF729|nr:GyrI-like domain-containing protein [Aquimarina sp. AD10]AXT62746.1 hypothetical protein D1816_21170 [Aquimarina sp. AD10]RKN01930.1 hypothetical protein D7033_02535 [Aquimarina sp. AD10]
MMHIKRIAFGCLISLLVFFAWYLFIKTYDFEVVIQAETSPGTVYHNVLGWNASLNKGNTKTVFSKKKPFENLIHTYDFESYKLEFDWKMHKINDSITKVFIGVNDLDKPIRTRIKKLLGISPIQTLIHQEFTGFNATLLSHLDQFKVVIDGEQKSPESFVAYVNISCNQNAKAVNMINNSTYINTFLKSHNLALKSNPFIEILDWNKNTGELNFNFCFPIEKLDDFPVHSEIKYKKVVAKKSLKATFQGNYSYIDRAWYALCQYTLDKQIKPLKTIIEVYHNNPHTDVKDVKWTAEVYMEIE